MKIGSRLTVVTLMLLSVQLFAQIQWQNLETINDLHEYDPDLITYTLEQIDLNYPGLEKVKEADEAGNPVDAATALLNYYRQNSTAENYRIEKPLASERTIAEADTILKKYFYDTKCQGAGSISARWT